mgnify:CR=1 FL=1
MAICFMFVVFKENGEFKPRVVWLASTAENSKSLALKLGVSALAILLLSTSARWLRKRNALSAEPKHIAVNELVSDIHGGALPEFIE